MIALCSLRKFIYCAFCFLKSLVICFCPLLKESRSRTGHDPGVMKCWWEKHHPEKWIFIRPFLWWWWQYWRAQGDGSLFPYGLTGVGWLPVAGPLQPRWQNVFKLGNLPSPDGITLPKCVCNWEDGEGLALSCGQCLDLCAHFQVVFRLLRDDEWTEDRAVSVFVGSFPRLKARILRLKFVTKKKERKGVQTKEKDSSPNFSVHITLCVSVTFSWCLHTHMHTCRVLSKQLDRSK